jgi:hypothetical protein
VVQEEYTAFSGSVSRRCPGKRGKIAPSLDAGHDAAAGDRDERAGDVARQIRRQERDDVRQLLVGAAAAQRDCLRGAFADLAGFALAVADGPARGDLVDRDLVLADLLRQDAQHAVHAALAGDIGRLTRGVLHGALGVGGDDAAPALLDHRRDERLGHQDVVQDTGPELVLVVLGRLLQDAHPAVLADGVVDDDVRIAKALADRVAHGEHGVLAGDVGLDDEGPAAHRLDIGRHLARLVLALTAVVHGDIRPALGKRPRHDPAELPARARDDGDLVREVYFHGYGLSRLLAGRRREGGGQGLGLARLGGFVAGFDDLDDVAGMLGRRDRRDIFANPIDELHRILEDVRLAHVPMRADDVRELLDGTQAGVAAGIVNLLAVQLGAVNGALRAVEVRLAEIGHHPGERAVDEGELVVAEVRQNHGVIVRVARIHLALELALRNADAGHRRDALRRAEDAGERVKAVDRHIVERAAAGLAPVPGRVDVGERAVAGPDTLMLVVRAERRTRDRPRQLADRAVQDQLAQALVVRAEHLARRRNDLDARLRGLVDEIRRLGGRGRHSLVEMDVLAGLDRLQALLVVNADRRADDDGVDAIVGEQLLIRAV